MGIRFYCPDCGRRLNIKAFLAGKRGICPHCDSRVLIPMESQLPADAPKYRPTSDRASPASVRTTAAAVPSSPAMSGVAQPAAKSMVAEAATDPIAEAPECVWYVRPPAGGQYGPARGDVMQRWLSEGRVSADSMVWREGWEDWKLAGSVFSALDPVSPSPKPIAVHSAPAFVVPEDEEQDISKPVVAPARRVAARAKKKSIAPLVILGLLIVVLLVVTVVIVRNA